MPRLLPQIQVDSIRPESEREVIASLIRELPDEAVILHSFETLLRDRGQNGRGVARLMQGETDVVVLWPGKGMLVLEVKGGRISIDGNGNWISTDRYGKDHRIKDPFEQARGNMHTIIERVAENLNLTRRTLGFTYGYAVVLPSRRVEGVLPYNADPAILCDGNELKTIGVFVERALKMWGGKVDPRARKVKFSKVIDAILPSMRLIPSLGARLQSEQAVLHRMTQEQARFLEFARAQHRARIWGVAGSGKTILAVQQAHRFASQGKKTVFLCYNRSLAEWIRNSIMSNQATFEIYTFHEFCESVTSAAGAPFDVPDDPIEADLFWKEKSAELLLEHAEEVGLEIDALVVDEGQDFRSGWWDTLECLVHDDAPVYVFYDEHQDLFRTDGMSTLETWLPVRLDLPTNCRNTKAIATWAANILSIDGGVSDQAPEGIAVTVEVTGCEDKRRDQVKSLVSKWLKDEKIESKRIAILSPWRPERGCMSDVTKIAGVPLTPNVTEWQEGEGVLLTTIRSFKGLEADAIVMIDLPKPGTRAVFGESDFYVGCSRARNVLHLIATEAFDRDYACVA